MGRLNIPDNPDDPNYQDQPAHSDLPLPVEGSDLSQLWREAALNELKYGQAIPPRGVGAGGGGGGAGWLDKLAKAIKGLFSGGGSSGGGSHFVADAVNQTAQRAVGGAAAASGGGGTGTGLTLKDVLNYASNVSDMVPSSPHQAARYGATPAQAGPPIGAAGGGILAHFLAPQPQSVIIDANSGPKNYGLPIIPQTNESDLTLAAILNRFGTGGGQRPANDIPSSY